MQRPKPLLVLMSTQCASPAQSGTARLHHSLQLPDGQPKPASVKQNGSPWVAKHWLGLSHGVPVTPLPATQSGLTPLQSSGSVQSNSPSPSSSTRLLHAVSVSGRTSWQLLSHVVP